MTRTGWVVFGFLLLQCWAASAQPTVSGFTPTATYYGETLTIDGTNFDGTSGAVIDTLACDSTTLISSTRVECVTPNGSGFLLGVSVTNGAQTGVAAATFTYSVPGIITMIGAPEFPGETVTVNGWGFGLSAGTGARVIRIDGQACDSVGYLDQWHVVCQGVPVHTGQSLAINVQVLATSTTSAGQFSYTIPTVSSITPSVSKVWPGQTLTIQGSLFGKGSHTHTANIGGQACTNTNFIAAGQLECVLPVPSGGWTGLAVSVTVQSQTANLGGGPYLVTFTGPTVTSLSPSMRFYGGDTLTLDGSDFYASDPTPVVSIDGTQETASWVSSTRITVAAPNGSGSGLDVQLTVFGQTSAVQSGVFTYATPTITGITPDKEEVGNTITIQGSYFGTTSGITASLGGTLCTSTTWVSASAILCEVPSGTGGSITVAVTKSGQTDSEAAMFSYLAPSVTAVSPSRAYPGETVTIDGSSFGVSGATAAIDATACTAVTHVSTSRALCTVPSGTGSGLSVHVTDSGSNFGTMASGFSYNAPTVTSITPTVAYAGDTVTISGTDFGLTDLGTTVDIGASTCNSPTWTSSSAVTCVVPTGTGTGVDVKLTVLATYIGTGSSLFGYASPTLTSVSPSTGPAGDQLTLYGTSFRSDATVTIDGVSCTPVTYVTASQISCTIPAAGVGVFKDVIVTVATDSSTVSGAFTYQTTVTALTPSSLFPATPSASDILTISGTNFDTAENVAVSIGGDACQSITHVSTSVITCLPPVRGGSGLLVHVTVGGVQGADPTVYFSYKIPTVSTVTPTEFYSDDVVTVTGSQFGSTSDGSTKAYVGSKACGKTTVVSDTALECVVPSTGDGRDLMFKVDVRGQEGYYDGVVQWYMSHVPVAMATASQVFASLSLTGSAVGAVSYSTTGLGGSALGSMGGVGIVYQMQTMYAMSQMDMELQESFTQQSEQYSIASGHFYSPSSLGARRLLMTDQIFGVSSTDTMFLVNAGVVFGILAITSMCDVCGHIVWGTITTIMSPFWCIMCCVSPKQLRKIIYFRPPQIVRMPTLQLIIFMLASPGLAMSASAVLGQAQYFSLTFYLALLTLLVMVCVQLFSIYVIRTVARDRKARELRNIVYRSISPAENCRRMKRIICSKESKRSRTLVAWLFYFGKVFDETVSMKSGEWSSAGEGSAYMDRYGFLFQPCRKGSPYAVVILANLHMSIGFVVGFLSGRDDASSWGWVQALICMLMTLAYILYVAVRIPFAVRLANMREIVLYSLLFLGFTGLFVIGLAQANYISLPGQSEDHMYGLATWPTSLSLFFRSLENLFGFVLILVPLWLIVRSVILGAISLTCLFLYGIGIRNRTTLLWSGLGVPSRVTQGKVVRREYVRKNLLVAIAPEVPEDPLIQRDKTVEYALNVILGNAFQQVGLISNQEYMAVWSRGINPMKTKWFRKRIAESYLADQVDYLETTPVLAADQVLGSRPDEIDLIKMRAMQFDRGDQMPEFYKKTNEPKSLLEFFDTDMKQEFSGDDDDALLDDLRAMKPLEEYFDDEGMGYFSNNPENVDVGTPKSIGHAPATHADAFSKTPTRKKYVTAGSMRSTLSVANSPWRYEAIEDTVGADQVSPMMLSSSQQRQGSWWDVLGSPLKKASDPQEPPPMHTVVVSAAASSASSHSQRTGDITFSNGRAVTPPEEEDAKGLAEFFDDDDGDDIEQNAGPSGASPRVISVKPTRNTRVSSLLGDRSDDDFDDIL